MIVDDGAAHDEFMHDVLTLAAPPGIPVEVLDVAAAAVRCSELAAAPEPVMVLARSPETVLRLVKAGVPIDVVDLGGLGAGPGRRRLHRTVSASAEELAQLRELEDLGVKVEIRIVPDGRPIPLRSIDRRP